MFFMLFRQGFTIYKSFGNSNFFCCQKIFSSTQTRCGVGHIACRGEFYTIILGGAGRVSSSVPRFNSSAKWIKQEKALLEVLRLVFRTQEIESGFDRIKGTERYFHEHRVPVSHGTIPQARKLEGFQRTPLMGLTGDKIGP